MTRIVPVASAKMLMHASKYAHCDVVGAVLVADGQVVDVVPLAHNPLTATIADSGLAVVRSWRARPQRRRWAILLGSLPRQAERLAKAAGAQLAGVYVGRATAKEDVLGSVHARLADAVQAHCGSGSPVFVLQVRAALRAARSSLSCTHAAPASGLPRAALPARHLPHPGECGWRACREPLLLTPGPLTRPQRFSKKSSGSWTAIDTQSSDALEPVGAAALGAIERAMEAATADRIVDYEDMLAAPGLDLANAFVGALL